MRAPVCARGVGGGTYNFGTMSLVNSRLISNSANGGLTGTFGGDGIGGGIYNSGALSVASATLNGNSANGRADENLMGFVGGSASGGAIANAGTLSATNTTFSANSADGGFGDGAGGDASGGGIASSGGLSATNSTFSGNSAEAGSSRFGSGFGSGGGIQSSGVLSVIFSTLSGNSAFTGGGIAVADGPQTKVDCMNSIFQNTGGGNVSVAAGSVIHSLGHNVFSDAPSFTVDTTDLVNTDPLLGPLADNGGPTFTQALLAGSPAINAAVAVAGITTDERGAPRPRGSGSDIGAFEVQPPLTIVRLARHGMHRQPTALVVNFNLPLEVSRAESLKNYRLVGPGPDHRFNTSDDRVFSIRFARYDATSLMVTLRPKQRLPLSETFRLTVVGKPPRGLTTTVGAYLAGAGSAKPGTNAELVITGKSLVLTAPM